jgi:hypothetical protein
VDQRSRQLQNSNRYSDSPLSRWRKENKSRAGLEWPLIEHASMAASCLKKRQQGCWRYLDLASRFTLHSSPLQLGHGDSRSSCPAIQSR